MKNLQNFGVHELDAKEIREIDGGFLILVMIVTDYLVTKAIEKETVDFVKGYKKYYSL